MPAAPARKPADRFRLIGNPEPPRKNSGAKTDGSATFAIDMTVPGMVHAVILRSPKFGGRLASFDASRAPESAGFLDARALPDGSGVAVFGGSSWAAIRARDAVTAEWDFGEAERRSTAELVDHHLGLLDEPEYQVRPGGDFAGTGAAIEAAATRLTPSRRWRSGSATRSRRCLCSGRARRGTHTPPMPWRP